MNQPSPDQQQMANNTVIILAAGKGKRMNCTGPKILVEICGRSILAHQLDTIRSTGLKRVILVINPTDQDLFKPLLNEYNDLTIQLALQETPMGTAHAVIQALPLVNTEQVITILGDVPFVPSSVFKNAFAHLQTCHITTSIYENPTGLGRIIRNTDEQIVKIVEQKDCSVSENNIKEANTGIIAVKTDLLKTYAKKIHNHNNQQEFYLTDLIQLLTQDQLPIQSDHVEPNWLVQGCNSVTELIYLERKYQKNLAQKLLQQGVKLKDPHRFDCRGELSCGHNVSIDINVIIEGKVIIGDNCTIGAACILKDVTIGNNVDVKPFSHLENTCLDHMVKVGPFSYCREGTHLHQSAQLGCFVETKRTTIGANSKAKHLSYLGDLSIGESTNIGAGVIHCNYDGQNKHQSTVKNHAFIGANTAIIGPVSIDDHTTVAAGTTITNDVPESTLAIGRSKQQHIEKWKLKSPKKESV